MSADTQAAHGTRSAQHEPVDALAGAFAELARYDNTNTNQIAVVQGALDAGLLAGALSRALRMFPLLLAGFPPRKAAPTHADTGCATVSVHEWNGACDLADPSFRALLMGLNQRNRLDWKRRLPFQLYLVLAHDRQTSCVYLSCAHAVADARSDCLLFERIMREYATCRHRGSAVAPERTYGFDALQRIHPEWYTPGARLRRRARALVSIGQDLLRFDRGLPRERTASVPHAQLDFYRSVADAALAESIARAARRAGVTVNTLFVAALARVIERLNRRRGPVRLTCAISLRFTLDARYVDTFRNYLVAVGLRIPAGLPGTALLAHVHDAVRTARRPARLQLELGRLEWLATLLRLPALYPVTRVVVGRSQGTNVCFSNPGLIREDFSHFGDETQPAGVRLPVTQYVGFGCLVEPYDFILYTPTVNGRLQLDAVYRSAAFTDFNAEFIEPYRAELGRLIAEIDEQGAPDCRPADRDTRQDTAELAARQGVVT